MPGCIQAHGALLALRLSDFTILQASENSANFFDDPPEALLGQSIVRVIGQDKAAILRELLVGESVECSAKYAFSMLAIDGATTLDMCVHTNDGVLMLEFEATQRNAQHDGRDYFTIVKAAICRIQAANSLRDFASESPKNSRKSRGSIVRWCTAFTPTFTVKCLPSASVRICIRCSVCITRQKIFPNKRAISTSAFGFGHFLTLQDRWWKWFLWQIPIRGDRST
jgi:hypothetical protein